MSSSTESRALPDEMVEITASTLREALAQPGRSQSELARLLGIDASAVNRMANGRRQIKASELRTIYDYLSNTGKRQSTTISVDRNRVRLQLDIEVSAAMAARIMLLLEEAHSAGI